MGNKKVDFTVSVEAETTRDKILRAAQVLFVENGYAGTSIGKIASLAEVNHSLIFHHFTNKQSLWNAVKASITEKVNASTPLLPSTSLSFAAFLKQLIRRSIDFYRTHPDVIRMLNWQRLEHANEQAIGLTLSPEVQAWLKAFQFYQQRGDINPKVKLEFVISLILSVMSSAALDPNVFINSPEKMEAYIEFCISFILKGLDYN